MNAFLHKRNRTVDQMVQAARSGKQNIIEGRKAATTSKEMEIKLTNVARARSCWKITTIIFGFAISPFGAKRAAKQRPRANWA